MLTDDQPKRGVGLEELILSLLELIHQLLEKQVIRRMESGHFTDAELESLGGALHAQNQQIDLLCKHFSIQRENLDILNILDSQGRVS